MAADQVKELMRRAAALVKEGKPAEAGGVLARVPLASGFLSGKYDKDSESAENDVRCRRDRERIRQTVEQVNRMQEEEVPEGIAMAQWAVAWCLKHPAVTCVIPGCKSVEQVESNAGAPDLDMVPDEQPRRGSELSRSKPLRPSNRMAFVMRSSERSEGKAPGSKRPEAWQKPR